MVSNIALADSPGLLRLWRYLHLRRNCSVLAQRPVDEDDASLLRCLTKELIARGLL